MLSKLLLPWAQVQDTFLKREEDNLNYLSFFWPGNGLEMTVEVCWVGWIRRQELNPGAVAPLPYSPSSEAQGNLILREIWSWGKCKDLHEDAFVLGFAPVYFGSHILLLMDVMLRRLSPWCQGGDLLVMDRDAASVDQSIDRGVRCWNNSPDPTERGPNLPLDASEPPEKALGLSLCRYFSSRKNLFLHEGECAVSTYFSLDGFSRFFSGSV